MLHDPEDRTGESKTAYDPKTGYVIAEIDPEGRATRYARYPADHPSAGRLATVADAAGKERHVAYTPRGEQRAVWGDSVQPLLYEYNDYGERIAMRTFQTLPNGDPSHEEDKGARTAWHYDEATGALLRKEYADGHGPEYLYTEAGQLKERQWARESDLASSDLADSQSQESKRAKSKMATSYSYDETTLQLKKTIATDGTEVSYEYNPEGHLSKVTDATGSREFAYDLRGQIIKESVTLLTGPDSPPIRYEIHRSYTSLAQPESVHLVSAEGEALELDHKIDYGWNPRNQLASVKSLAGEFDYEYNEANPALLAKMTGPVHEVETTYEPHRNLITGVTNFAKRGGAGSTLPADGGGAVLSSYAYSNDVLGRRETISQGGEAFAMLKLGGTKVDVAYNDRSEVVGATYRAGNETRQQFSYDYDGIGNRKEARSVVDGERSTVSYKTNALNQYQEISENQRKSAVRPSYDLDGNLAEDLKNRYTWDSENRLVRVESKTGDLRIEYLHDYQSRRTVRIETKHPGKENEERRTTCYLYDDWNLLAELESVPSVASRSDFGLRVSSLLTWGRDLSGSLQGAGGVGGLLAVSEGESHRFPAYDANGNVSQLVDELGAITAAYTYDPFGNVTEMAGPEAESNPWRFSTKPVDAGTGWLYYGFRYYQPDTGRWLSRDPIQERGGINLYGFVSNNPIDRFDLLGLEQITVSDMTTPLAGAAVGGQIVANGKTLTRLGGTWFYISGNASNTGWKGASDSHLLIWKKGDPKKKIYRLDYGHNAATGVTDWHHNQKGVATIRGLQVTNHSTQGAQALGTTISVFRWAGRAAVVGGLAVGAYDIYHAEDRIREGVVQLGGFAGAVGGAWAGGKVGAGGGAAVGAFFFGAGAGPGALIGGAFGAIGGGVAGYWGGSTAAGHLYDWVFTPLAHEEWEIVCVPGVAGGG